MELSSSAHGILGLQVQGAHTGAHGQCIINIVVTGHAQLQVGERLTQLQHVELKETGLVLLDIDGTDAGFLVDAETDHRAVDGADHVHGVAVVHVKDHRAGQQRKLLEGQFQLAHGAVIFQMVVVNVQNHADCAGQVQEGLVVLAGFDNDTLAVAGLAVTIDKGQLAADNGSRVLAGQLQHGGDHAGGGGLAMGAGYADALRMAAADVAQQHAALHRFDAAGTGGLQLGVVVMDGGTVNDQLRIAHVSGIVADKHPHAQRTFGFGVLGLLYVRTGDRIALAVQDLDQRIGAGAAAADEMHGLHAVQQFGIKHCINHQWSPQKSSAPGSGRGSIPISYLDYSFFLSQKKQFFEIFGQGERFFSKIYKNGHRQYDNPSRSPPRWGVLPAKKDFTVR